MPCLTCGRPNGGAGYCEAHQPQRQHKAQGVSRAKPKGSATSRGYDAAWRSLRAQVLREDSQCHWCGGRADTVDHVMPIRFAPELRLDRANLVPACRACNSSRSNVTHSDM